MNAPADESPERLLSAALRAQATGGWGPPAHPASPPQPEPTARPRKLPVLRVLLFAVVLGLAAGSIVGGLTLM